jgi:hypothetical protein
LLAMAPRRVHLTTGVRYRAQRLTLNLGKSGRFPTEASGLATLSPVNYSQGIDWSEFLVVLK